MFAGLAVTEWLEPVELTVYDTLFAVRGPRAPTLPLVIVTIDESSIAELNQPWPFPRAMHGHVLTSIAAGQPLVIGVDLIFDMPSARGPADDEALGAAIAEAGNVVLAAGVSVDAQPMYTRTTLNVPLPVIRKGAIGVAAVNAEPDTDGHQRRAMLWVPLHNEYVRSFDLHLYEVVAKAGVRVAPLVRRHSVLINFRGGPRTYPRVSYYRVVRGEIPSSFWAGKIVLIGSTSELLHDEAPTPFARSGDMPGVEIHANTLETLVRGNAVHEVPVAVSAAFALVAGVVVGALVAWWPGRAAETTFALYVISQVSAYAAFVWFDVWFRASAPAGALVAGLVLAIVARGDRPPPSA